jgi:hypothetical protein
MARFPVNDYLTEDTEDTEYKAGKTDLTPSIDPLAIFLTFLRSRLPFCSTTGRQINCQQPKNSLRVLRARPLPVSAPS